VMSSNMVDSASTDTGPGDEAVAGGLFVRRSSGLVRDIGLRGAFGLNLGYLSVGGALGYLALVLGLFPGVDLTWALLIGGGFTALLGFVYSQLAVSLARDGGDYVYQARIFHPIVGAWVGVALIVVFWFTFGTAGAFYVSNFMTFSFTTLGDALHIGFFNTLASDLATKSGTLLGGLAILLITIGICLAGPKASGRAAYWFVIVGVIGAALIVVELLFHGTSAFRSAFDHHSGGSGAYNAVLTQASHHGWKPGTTMAATINAIPYGFLAFGGFWMAVYEGGEVKRPASTQKIAAMLAIGFGILLVVGAWLVMRWHAGLGFIQASVFLSNSAPDVYGHITSVSVSPQSYAVIVAGDPVTKVVIALSFLAWMFPGTIAATMAVSRLLFALSFDRLVPAWMASVSGRRRQPVASLALTGVVGMTFYAIVVYDTGITGAFRNLLTAGAVISFMACLAVMALPYRRRDLYDASPKIIAGRLFGVERIVWVGGVAGVFCAVVTYLTVAKGQYSGGFTATSIVGLLVLAGLGPVIYLVSRAVRGRQGIDVSLAMRELPPE
jgi:amino acid transporter